MKSEIQSEITKLKEAVSAKDSTNVKSLSDQLQQSLQKIAETVYSQTENSGPDGSDIVEDVTGEKPDSDANQESPEDTVEGEFREV